MKLRSNILRYHLLTAGDFTNTHAQKTNMEFSVENV
jgi:hypothetical protein